MAILFKAVATGSGAATATTASLGAAAVGDLVVVALGVAENPSGTITDNAGNTYTVISTRFDGVAPTGGAAIAYSILTVANAALTVSCTPSVGPVTLTAHLLSGASAYNADKNDSADFSGTSAAWAVGPTTLVPPANSIAFYCLGAAATETATPNAAGYNTTGVNGFTAAMNTTMHQETKAAGSMVCVSGYQMTSAAASAAITLPAAAKWFGVIATFAPTVPGTASPLLRRRHR